MLSTLLLSLACAAPAQDPAAPLVDLLPSDSLVVVEVSLEPWDRLRKQTRAHVLLRGQDILKTTLSIAADLGTEQESDSLRSALGAVRFSLALTAASLEQNSALLIVEPLGLEAAGFDWEKLLLEMTGVRPVKLGRGLLTLVGEGPVDSEAVDTYLASLVKAAQAGESTLGSQAAWTSLNREISSPNDLLRVTLPGWNWNANSLVALTGGTGAGDSEADAAFFDAIIDFFGLKHGFVWTTSIQGTDVIDRMLIPRDKDEPSYWSTLGAADQTLDRLGSMQSGMGIATAYAMDMPALFGAIESVIGRSMALEGQSLDDDPVLVALMDSMRGVMASIGPNLFAWQSLEDAVNGGMGNYQIQVRDRAALEAAWAKMPQEVSALLPLLLMQFGAGPDAVELTDTMLSMRLGSVLADEEPLATSDEFKQTRSEVLAYLDGAEPLLIQTMPIEMDRLWLTQGGGLFAVLETLFGIELVGNIKPEQLKSLRSIWLAGKRTDRGIEMHARSTFGVTVSSGLSGIMQALLLGESNTVEALEEDEF